MTSTDTDTPSAEAPRTEPGVTRRRALRTAAGALGALAVGSLAEVGGAGEAQAAEQALPEGYRGNMSDLKHVVVLMQENRSFDHYFGTMNGVRGFSDPHPAPAPGVDGRARDVLLQHDGGGEGPAWLAPFPLNTRQTFTHMRVEGTPHSWPDAQAAWDDGRMGR